MLSSLTRDQKQAIGLLNIGTFLEYFDLMLYLHMAVLLNDLFFPKTDAHTASLLSAVAFCSTFVFRPVGALIFGWMGDNIGRKSTIILTTLIMSVSCIVMANLPTYDQIGIAAAWIMIICRVAQGMSSMGEIMGAQIYIAESVPRPYSYQAVGSLIIATDLGAVLALTVAVLAISFNLNWRSAFWIGSIIAVVGSVARTRLRETPDFLEMKRQRIFSNNIKQQKEKAMSFDSPSWKQETKFNNLVAFLMVYCGLPLTFFLTFIYFNPLLKEKFGYTAESIIKHNLFLSIVVICANAAWLSLCNRIHPTRILKLKGLVALCLFIAIPFIMPKIVSESQLFFLQVILIIFSLNSMPADAVFLYYFPVYRRFTFATCLYAVSRALMYIITTFGIVYLSEYFGYYGLWFITIPITLIFIYGVLHFERLERNADNLIVREIRYPG